jgi:hypothetical protein
VTAYAERGDRRLAQPSSNGTLRSARLPALVALSVFVTTLLVRLAHVTSDRFVGTWGDDFFYYLKIASNVIAGHGSTFDGRIATNGYHPLWMLCVLSLVAALGNGLALLTVIAGLLSAGSALTFVFARKIAARVLGSAGFVSYCIGLYTAVYYYKVASDGMEVILTVPLLLIIVERVLRHDDAPLRPAPLGLLCAIAVLSRLDSIFFVALLSLGIALSGERRPLALARFGAAFLLGFSPVFAYVLFNRLAFGELLPVSGAAKQLKQSGLMALRIPVIYRYGRVFDGLMFYPSLLICAVAPLLCLSRAKRWRAETTQAFLPILVFPWLFYLAQMCVSDWPLWCWYIYPVVAAFPLALSYVLRELPLAAFEQALQLRALRVGSWPLWLVLTGAPLLLGGVQAARPQAPTPIYTFARVLSRFAETHAGRYAMGDRAGAVGFVLPFPLLQLEGLVEDRRFIANIRARRDLRDVLKEYDVNYYVASGPAKVGSCYYAAEPAKAGPSSPQMLGVFCEDPVFTYMSDSDGTLNVVFKVAD